MAPWDRVHNHPIAPVALTLGRAPVDGPDGQKTHFEDYGILAEVAFDPAGDLYVAGYFRDTFTIADHELVAVAEYDTVLIKILACPAP